MPFLAVSVAAKPNPVLSATIARELSQLTDAHLHKDPAVMAIAISYVDPEHWFAGGRSLAGADTKGFWLDIKVTDATNTKSEMADYIAAVFAMMARVLGAVHEHSYILVHAVPAAAYGFGGKTQELRFIAGRLETAA
jgi:4-oxalocrotonate tautomerase